MPLLKLEKTTRDISITFRKREPTWNRLFLQAFACALTLHASVLFVFHIQSLKHTSSFVFPPIEVVSHPQEQFSLLVDPVEKDSDLFGDLIDSPVPHVPIRWEDNQLNWKQVHLPALSPSEIPLPIQSLAYQPIQVNISGNLAELPLIKGSAALKIALNKETFWQEYYTRFEVHVDPASGNVFWYRQHLSSGTEIIDAFAERIVKELQFAPTENWDHSSGEIAIAFILDDLRRVEALND